MITVSCEVEIAAPPAQVWNCLMDFRGYPEWNPLIPSITGEARANAELKVRLTPPGLIPSNYTLRVLRVEPFKEFRWLGHFLFPGLMDGNHAFLIEPQGDRACRLIQVENFSGWLVPVLGPFLRRNMLAGFENMNAALKKRAESMKCE